MATMPMPALWAMQPRQIRKCGDSRDEDAVNVRMEKIQRKQLRILARQFRHLHDGHAILCQQNLKSDVGHHSKSDKFVQIVRLRNTADDVGLQLQLATNRMWKKRVKRAYKKSEKFLQHYLIQMEVMDVLMYNVYISSNAVDKLTVGLVQFQLKLDKVYNFKEKKEGFEKRVQRLESLLYVYTCRFGKIQVKNTQLRRDVNNLLTERHFFYDVHKRMNRSLNMMKEQQNKVAEKSYTTYEVIEEAHERRMRLKKTNDIDCRAYVKEIHEQRRIVNDFWKLVKFLESKNKHRTYITTDDARKKRRNANLMGFYNRTIGDYKNSFRLIKQVVGGMSNDRILNYYNSHVEKNNAMFQYQNDLYDENNWLEEEIKKLNNKNDQLKKFMDELDSGYAKKIQEQRVSLAMEKLELAHQKEQASSNEKSINFIMQEIDALFTISKADKTPVMELLGNNHEWVVHPRQFPFILNVIDSKVRQLVVDHEKLKTVKEERDLAQKGKHLLRHMLAASHKALLYPTKIKRGPVVPLINEAKWHQAAEEDEEEEKIFSIKPMTKDQMKLYCYRLYTATSDLFLHESESSTDFTRSSLDSSMSLKNLDSKEEREEHEFHAKLLNVSFKKSTLEK